MSLLFLSLIHFQRPRNLVYIHTHCQGTILDKKKTPQHKGPVPAFFETLPQSRPPLPASEPSSLTEPLPSSHVQSLLVLPLSVLDRHLLHDLWLTSPFAIDSLS